MANVPVRDLGLTGHPDSNETFLDSAKSIYDLASLDDLLRETNQAAGRTRPRSRGHGLEAELLPLTITLSVHSHDCAPEPWLERIQVNIEGTHRKMRSRGA